MDRSKKFHEPFVYAALAIALVAGFGFGALLVLSVAAGARLSSWYGAVVQAHGHAQLFGWVGLFVLGVGLYFLPRLRGTQLRGTSRLPWAFALLVSGIVLRCVVQPLAGWVGTNELLRALFLLSAVLELAGMLVVGSMLVQTERSERKLAPDAPAYVVEPFAQMAFLCLALAFLCNLLGVGNAVVESKNLVAPRYDQLVIVLMQYGVVVPMALVFSIRSLPLFLYLEPVSPRGWRTMALLYFLALVLRVLPFVFAIADDIVLLTGRALRANYLNVLLPDALAVLGVVLLNALILVAVARLRLWHQRPPRATPMRRGIAGGQYPDHGEYGRFELLIYSAFVWLVIASGMDLVRALPLVNEQVLVPQDAARHAFTVGFITLLIFGMAVRLLPGFSGKRGIALPALVTWLFILGNAAVLLRVLPLLLPNFAGAVQLLALSGLVGWSAVLLLAILLWKTLHLEHG